eukprot:Nk52_evm59s2309 gene=Nk52_evmTU59s2309
MTSIMAGIDGKNTTTAVPAAANTAPEYVFNACTSNNPSMITFLFQNGADLNCVDPITGETPLIYSCRINNADCVRALLQCGASHDFKDIQGWTALHWAAYGGNSENVELLFVAGANLNAVSNHGQVPSELAFFQGHSNVGMFIRSGAEQQSLQVAHSLSVSDSLHGSLDVTSPYYTGSYDEAAYGVVPSSGDSSSFHGFDSAFHGMSCPEPLYGYSAFSSESKIKRKCIRCSATQTPQWRRGPDGEVNLCNACGLRHLKILKSQAKNKKAEQANSVPTDAKPTVTAQMSN